jgi:glycosyltransferase involved in cell wall biosynthesis
MATRMKVQVFASEKVRPAFDLLSRLVPVEIAFTDWSLSPRKFIRNLSGMVAADLIYFHSPTNLRIIMMPLARLLGKPVMLQWIGTDVLTVTWKKQPPFWDAGLEQYISVKETLLAGLTGIPQKLVLLTLHKSELFTRFLKYVITHHVVCAPQLAVDLEKVGIHASYLPVLCHIEPELLPLPQKTAFLAYTGYHAKNDTRAFYGWHSLLRLAQDYPDLIFLVIGHVFPKEDKIPNNIINLGYVNNIREILSQVTGLLRLTYHDGMPRLVLEAMAMARYIIYSQPFPHTFYAQNYDELKKAVDKIRQENSPNIEGMKYIQQNFNIQYVAEQFLENFNTTYKQTTQGHSQE